MAIVEAPFLTGLGARFHRSAVPEDADIIHIIPAPAEPEFLGRGETLYQYNNLSRVKSYFRGWHSELGGVLTNKGWQGQETIVEHDVIRPIRTFMVEAKTNGHIPLRSNRPWSYLTKILGLF